jgi:hypothetical protein
MGLPNVKSPTDGLTASTIHVSAQYMHYRGIWDLTHMYFQIDPSDEDSTSPSLLIPV